MTQPPWVTLPYRPGSEREIVALWNRCLVLDGVTDAAFQRKVLLDPNFHRDGARTVWSPGGEVIGFCYAVARRVPMMGADLAPAEPARHRAIAAPETSEADLVEVKLADVHGEQVAGLCPSDIDAAA